MFAGAVLNFLFLDKLAGIALDFLLFEAGGVSLLGGATQLATTTIFLIAALGNFAQKDFLSGTKSRLSPSRAADTICSLSLKNGRVQTMGRAFGEKNGVQCTCLLFPLPLLIFLAASAD